MTFPRTKEILLSYILVVLWSAIGVLAVDEYDSYNQDITNHREYGCSWYGGTTSRLSCNCQDEAQMFVKKQSISSFSTTEIEINNCKAVTFEENCIADMRNLRHIYLNDIKSITFDRESMNWYGYKERGTQVEERFDITIPSLKITVTNSNVSLISSHAFAGRINEIVFDGVTIDKILPIAFANLLQTEKLVIRNTLLKETDVQAFKKFSVEFLELNGVTADVIPSRTFSNVTVYQNFTINNCDFGIVHSGGFTVYNPKVFQVTDTNISVVNGEAFKVVSSGNVLFRKNNFGVVNDGAFQGITVRRDRLSSDVWFVLDSNTFSALSRYSLNIPDFSVKFRNVYINEPCDCTAIDHKIKESAYYSDIMCLYEDRYLTLKYFKSNMCSVITNYYITIVIVCIVTVLVIVSVAALILYYKCVHRRKKYGKKERSENGKNISLIVPDGRTYRETELHVIVEKTDLLTTDL